MRHVRKVRAHPLHSRPNEADPEKAAAYAIAELRSITGHNALVDAGGLASAVAAAYNFLRFRDAKARAALIRTSPSREKTEHDRGANFTGGAVDLTDARAEGKAPPEEPQFPIDIPPSFLESPSLFVN